MFVNATHNRLRELTPAERQAYVAQVNSQLLPVLGSLGGFQSYWLVQVSDDHYMAITAWASRADFDKALPKLNDVSNRVVEPYRSGPPDRNAGEVVVAKGS